MKRLADYIPSDAPVSEDDTAPVDQVVSPDPVEAVFDFPDRPQPSVQQTLGAMVREVIAPDHAEEIDPEDEAFWDKAKSIDATPGIAAAFDRGAKLRMPEPPDEPVDPAIKKPARSRSRISQPTPARPAGSDQFTDLFAAGMIVVIAFSLGDEFQPTEDEAKDLARPLGNILARRVDLAKTLGQDSNDIIAFAIAVMAYSVRVGPVAADKVRGAYNDRQQRTRVDRVSLQGGIANGTAEDSVPTRADARTSSGDGATRPTLNAVAKARAANLGVVGRDLGPTANGRSPLADLG